MMGIPAIFLKPVKICYYETPRVERFWLLAFALSLKKICQMNE